MEHNFRVYKTAELAIMRLSYLSQIISNNELLSYLQDIAKQERNFYNSIEWRWNDTAWTRGFVGDIKGRGVVTEEWCDT
jgi:hypothetical protein